MSEFDTDRFILEVEARPALWDFESPEYSNKHLKTQAWDEVCQIVHPNFQSMKTSEKAGKCNVRTSGLKNIFTKNFNYVIFVFYYCIQ